MKVTLIGLCAVILFQNFAPSNSVTGFAYQSQEEFDEESKELGGGNPGLFPALFNVASISSISANATCGESISQPEVYCKLSDLKDKAGGADRRNSQCGVCDARSHDPAKKHPISHAIDNSTNWWQSPTLEQGAYFQWVTVTLDLKQEYYVWNLIMKCGISPRPAVWILEKSLDGQNYSPWQYFAPDDEECWERFNKAGVNANFPNFTSDTDVVCNTYFSKLRPFEGGEIHTYIAKGRPSCAPSLNALDSMELREFVRARYVRLRFQKLNAPRDRLSLRYTDDTIKRRLFYSIRSLSIGGQCICNGHAKKCRSTESNLLPTCQCRHNTCGQNCDHCCPLYNQKPWKEGSLTDASPCEKCQCFGRATACYYDPVVDANNKSINIRGKFSGGGVCINCTKHTFGTNCEQCEAGWYRPLGVSSDDEIPCLKCDCDPVGSDGTCVSIEDNANGKEVGSCNCLSAYAGARCDRCALGYFNYPKCEPCSCDTRGSVLTELCDVNCECKENMMGMLCAECKPGFFGLSADNPLGCKKCYCSDISTECREATGYFLQTIHNIDDWQIVNLETEIIREPTVDPDTGILTYTIDFGDDIDNFFWLAPSEFCGNKLTSYGTSLKFSITWRVMRGDTSGKAVINPDVILVGKNGLQISYGQNLYEGMNRMLCSVPLKEHGWYLFVDSSKESDEEVRYTLQNVTRQQMMSVLADIKFLLLRGRFHSDQIDTGLLSAQMDVGIKEINGTKGIELKEIEECSCPEGYAGLSCEMCAYGYVYVLQVSNTSMSFCKKCDCNQHSPTCDSISGKCDVCEHNTIGEKCEMCLPGYYGNAEDGTPNACKQCSCPLNVTSNNFSPTCIANETAIDEYMCDSCPIGYGGEHCQFCAEGYYGDPLTIGSGCFPCECNGSPCDTKTGVCVTCLGNTEGYHCERCKYGFYGNPFLKDCKPCQCNPTGSVDSVTCDVKSGQCLCKPKYTGRNCDLCQDGLGNVTAECVPCNCNIKGSVTTKCDPVTGECLCKKGVIGVACDSCAKNHFGFDTGNGCKECTCDAVGSVSERCNITSGQCTCRPNVTGRTCDTCEAGFWSLTTAGCIACDCNPIGSLSFVCDVSTGQCKCKSGVAGLKCDRCQRSHYGFSELGCFECDECKKPGHICDPENGRCVCPPLTEGLACDKCASSAWNFTAFIGCQACECDHYGSISNHCSSISGQCSCRIGYSGRKCSTCSQGYYGFPKCGPCSCNLLGTRNETCVGNKCLCDHNGQCYCKANVMGIKCDQCIEGTFDLHADNDEGCLSCFCFGRSISCITASFLTLSKIKLLSQRLLVVRYDANDTLYNFTISDLPVNPQEICYVNLGLQEDDYSGQIILNPGGNYLNVTNNLRVIPGDTENVEIGVNYLFNTPIYWKLPKWFLGDKILSYGGYLTFTVQTEGEKILFPPNVLSSYPLVQLQGNDRYVLEFFTDEDPISDQFKVRLHESAWKIKNNPETKITRQMFHLVLQNLQHVLIRATDSVNFSRAVLRDVTMETAIQMYPQSQRFVSSVYHGLEWCKCPPQYSGSSCQNPSVGYYRYYDNRTTSASAIIQIIGSVRPCDCGGKSLTCDAETGHCTSCSENTGGPHCNTCAEGFYNNTRIGVCSPCPCPTYTRNFAQTCHVQNTWSVLCICKRGYTGNSCERCDKGWYGNPRAENGSCAPCNCNPYGSLHNDCDPQTGQCACKQDIRGIDCSICPWRQVLSPHGCSYCTDDCAILLLDKIAAVDSSLETKTSDIVSGVLKPPWQLLNNIQSNLIHLKETLKEFSKLNYGLTEAERGIEEELRRKSKMLSAKCNMLMRTIDNLPYDIQPFRQQVEDFLKGMSSIEEETTEIISGLENYASKDKQKVGNILSAIKEARYLLSSLRDTDLEPVSYRANQPLSYCMYVENTLPSNRDIERRFSLLKKRIDKFMQRITDVDNLLYNITQINQKVKELSKENKLCRERVGQYLNHITESESYVYLEQKEIFSSTNYTRQLYRDAIWNLHNLNSSREELNKLKRIIEEKGNLLFNLNPVYLEQHVLPAMKHAGVLTRRAQQCANLFVPTKHDADVVLKASRAYHDIIMAIHDAKIFATNATITAYFRQLHPATDKQSLVNRAFSASKKSHSLKTSSEAYLRDISYLNRYVHAQISFLQTLKDQLEQAGKSNNVIVRQLLEFESAREKIGNVKDNLEELDSLGKKTLEISAGVRSVEQKMLNHVKPKLINLQMEREISIVSVDKKIKEAEEGKRQILAQLSKIKSKAKQHDAKFHSWNSSFADQLDALRSKITQTRHIVQAMQLSLSSSDSVGKCVRSYSIDNLEPSTVTMITLTYAVSSHHRDALLFYLQSSSTGDYVAIEMVNRKIRFVWDVGGGPGEVTHPHHIQTAGDLYKDQHWYKIEAERILNIGKLSVRPVVLPAGSPLMSGAPITNHSATGWGQFDVTSTDEIWIGGINSDKRPASLLSKQNSLVGCLHKVFFDNRMLGLWDFKTQYSDTCTACVEGAEELRDDGFYTFGGDGYAVLHSAGSSVYNKYLFTVTLSFRTFDEDAIIFYAAAAKQHQYVSLTLSHGIVVFRIGYGLESVLEVKTGSRYNLGNWTHIEATRYYDRKKKIERAVLKVGSESKEGAPSPPPTQDEIPDLSDPQYFIGGLSPGFKPLFYLPRSFKGCMSDIQINQEGYNPLRGRYFGIQPSCSSKPVTTVGFNGNGYIELASHPLRKRSSFGFVFASVQQDAFLMLSTTEGLTTTMDPLSSEDQGDIMNVIDNEQDNGQNYYSVSLRRGQIDVRLNAGYGETRLATDNFEYGDGMYHSVTVIKTGRRLELRVDDIVQSVASMPEGSIIVKAPGSAGGLFFGGIPPDISITSTVVSDVPLVGTIKNPVFGDRLISFESPIEFEHTDIGRQGPVPTVFKSDTLAAVPIHARNAVMGCYKGQSYSLELAAVRFGDIPHSHVRIDFQRRMLLHKNFSVEMKFRSYYQNGLLFLIPGKHPHYFMCLLRAGRVTVIIKGKRKFDVTSQGVYNDGIWHTVKIERRGKAVLMYVDGVSPTKVNIPKKLNVTNVMYIGGIPENTSSIPGTLLQKLESLKGCIKDVVINGKREDLVGEKSAHHKVGQCFPQIERGAYFNGDAYAVFKTNFYVGTLLQLELEFRTSEKSGILLSVSEPDGYPALSLELNYGKVIMSGDMGDRRPFRVEQEFSSEFALCDNRWHRIQVRYIDEELMLRVDNADRKYWLSDNGHLTEARTNSPLFIGGLADDASSGTLETRESFRGCMRNVIIGGEKTDWENLPVVHNVLFTSCPAAI